MGKEHKYNIFFTPEKWEIVNKVNKSIMDDYLQECQQKQMKETSIKQYKNDWRIVMIKIMEMFDNRVKIFPFHAHNRRSSGISLTILISGSLLNTLLKNQLVQNRSGVS